MIKKDPTNMVLFEPTHLLIIKKPRGERAESAQRVQIWLVFLQFLKKTAQLYERQTSFHQKNTSQKLGAFRVNS